MRPGREESQEQNQNLESATQNTPHAPERAPWGLSVVMTNIGGARIVESLHLVVVGSDAWLAKGQQPKPGSAILIHGNRNEPMGVKLMLEWVARQKKDSIYFLPLESIAGTGHGS
jgi:hypothetical protein